MTEERLLTVKTRISKKTLKYVLMLLLYFRPAVYVLGSSVYRVGTAGLIVELFYLVLVALLKHRNNRYQLSGVAGMLLMIFSWCLMGSTILNYFSGTDVSFNDAISFTATAAGFILFVDLGINDSPKTFLKSFVIVGSIACFINAITTFLYAGRGGMNQSAILSGGHWTYYFLAEDNATMYWSWPVIAVMWLYFFLFNNSKKMLVWNVVCTVTICTAYAFVRSLTAMLGTVALIFLCFITEKRAIRKEKEEAFILSREVRNSSFTGFLRCLSTMLLRYHSRGRNMPTFWSCILISQRRPAGEPPYGRKACTTLNNHG